MKRAILSAHEAVDLGFLDVDSIRPESMLAVIAFERHCGFGHKQRTLTERVKEPIVIVINAKRRSSAALDSRAHRAFGRQNVAGAVELCETEQSVCLRFRGIDIHGPL